MAKPEPQPDTKHEVITLTREQLRTIIQEAAGGPQAPPQAPSLEEAFDAHTRMMAVARERVVRSWYVAAVSLETGSRFVAFVSASRRHASGRVINLPHYSFPEGADRSTANGGLCPMNELLDTHGQPTPMFKQWKFAHFWQADLKVFAGNDASRLNAVGPARPTLEDAQKDLADYIALPPAEPKDPVIIARDANAG